MVILSIKKFFFSGESKMKPIESILCALIITLILFIVIDNLANSVDVHLAIFTFLIYSFGGVLATGLSKEYKIRYGLYYGLIGAIIYSFFSNYHLMLF